jgi:hypothetical protein
LAYCSLVESGWMATCQSLLFTSLSLNNCSDTARFAALIDTNTRIGPYVKHLSVMLQADSNNSVSLDLHGHALVGVLSRLENVVDLQLLPAARNISFKFNLLSSFLTEVNRTISRSFQVPRQVETNLISVFRSSTFPTSDFS